MRNWPLFDLRLTTPRLELRVPTLADLDALADLAADGVHAPGLMPFVQPWSDAPPAERARSTVQFQWRGWAEWTPEDWRCDFVVVLNGEIVGTQGLSARDFATVREVGTGSWVGLRHQGKGIGTEMRTAVLDLAFTGLGATEATSSAFADNPASLAVSRKLGYTEDGLFRRSRRATRATEIRLRLTRETWHATPHPTTEITALQPCFPLFGTP
ncbi:MAG TPA: GNAT family protein [Streptosporangiaceae bacterium]|jgi:RimJ/RimL family protein N-acetyltransferase